MPTAENLDSIAVRIQADLYRRLARVAENEHRSIAKQVKVAVLEHLATHEASLDGSA